MTAVALPTDIEIDDFRRDINGWLADNLPPAWGTTAFPRNFAPGDDDAEAVARSFEWHQRLSGAGWIAPGWPLEHGGRGLDLARRMVFVEEMARARAPVPVGFHGLEILGPALIAFGTDAQQRRFLPRILDATDLWCQGYSEPGSGSDLASMATRGVRDGDEYVVTGQKVWTSYGRRSNWCFLLVRTGSRDDRHRGISFLLTEMDAAGIEWRPIEQITGEQEFGELFLDEVRIPVDQRVGDEGEGWRVATHSLAYERLLAGNVAPIRARVDALLDLARAHGATPVERQRVAQLEARMRTATGVQARALQMANAGDARFPAWASMVKTLSTELRRTVAELAIAMVGPAGIASGPGRQGTALMKDGDEVALWAHEFLDARAATIYAGTSEIQRNIIGEVGLGLPREERAN